MKLIITTITILSFLFIYNPQTGVAQGNYTQGVNNSGKYSEDGFFGSRRWLAKDATYRLKTGTLIVRLVSYNEKIDFLEKKGNQEKANKAKAKIDKENKWLIKEFKESYKFSDVVFTYGLDLEKYLEDNNNNIFLDENLQVDPTVKVKEGPIYILGSQANADYYLLDTEFNYIPKPAPYIANYDTQTKKFGLMAIIMRKLNIVPEIDFNVDNFDRKLTKLAAW